MFTGIIQKKGIITQIEPNGDGLALTVQSPGFFHDVQIGDSVAVMGVCFSMEKISENHGEAVFTAISQTVSVTNVSYWKVGQGVNLEKPCSVQQFMSGHWVQGHVDGRIRVLEIIEKITGEEVVFELPAQWSKYLVPKGSVTLDGISLTLAEKGADTFKVALIPETLEKTIASGWKANEWVNLEVDVLGKYLEQFLTPYLEDLQQKAGKS